jgi:prepilin-type N-terminal cleavage/methylation domain-containing protein
VRNRRGFTLVELLVGIVIIAVLVSLLVPALAGARKAARAAACRSNLKQFGFSAGTYAIDFRGAIFSFSWTSRFGPLPSTQYPDLAVQPGQIYFDTEMGARQATDIIRRRSRTEPDFAEPHPWIPCVDYSHLVLLDYMSVELPVPIAACPEDRPLKLWQGDVAAFNAGAFGTQQPVFDTFEGRVMRAKPYSSSYDVVPASYDRSDAGARVSQGAGGQYYYGSNSFTKIGGLRVDQVAYPSLKVHMYDTIQRHGRRQLFFAHPEVVQPVLQFDSSVLDRATAEAGLGWRPNQPDAGPTIITYKPYQYEPATSTGAISEDFPGRYRWTRGGLKGVDFGPEVTGVR